MGEERYSAWSSAFKLSAFCQVHFAKPAAIFDGEEEEELEEEDEEDDEEAAGWSVSGCEQVSARLIPRWPSSPCCL